MSSFINKVGTIGEYCKVGDGAHASIRRIDSGVPYLMSRNLKNGTLDLTKISYISEADFQKHFKDSGKAVSKVRENDVIFGIIGSLGGAYLVRKLDRFGISSSVAILRPDVNFLFPQYLFYWVQGHNFQDALFGIKGGVAQGYVSLEMIKSLPLAIPPLQAQKCVSEILTAYDALIENNTRRIEILEEMARRLYEEWFVQFRFPGYEGVEFKESELGLIPVDWHLVPLGDIYRTGSGGTPSRKNPDFFGGDYRWVKTKELQDCPVFDTEEKISEDGLQKSSAKLFPRNSVLIAMYGATIGRLGVLQEESATNQACCAILPNSQGCGWGYAYLSLFSRRQALVDLRAGAAQQNISQDVIKRFKLLRASDELHEQFEMAVTPFLKLCFILYRKNANLRAQRDLLLPKLISGEIDVSDIPMAT